MTPSNSGVDGIHALNPEQSVNPNRSRIGVLGSAESWYFRDLVRASQLDHWDRPVELAPFSYSDLRVAYRGGVSSVLELDRDRSLDALLVRTMPLGSLEQTIFRMNALHIARSSGVRVVNPPRTLEIAIDKWLTLDFLRQAGLEIPKTVCCQHRDAAMAAWESLGKDCVVKPLFGGEGRGIVRVNNNLRNLLRVQLRRLAS
ncbi:MAG: RimK family alpha-L-glutamate ligase [Planctomycetaceae bacterium]